VISTRSVLCFDSVVWLRAPFSIGIVARENTFHIACASYVVLLLNKWEKTSFGHAIERLE
jgi:hypothetical protein